MRRTRRCRHRPNSGRRRRPRCARRGRDSRRPDGEAPLPAPRRPARGRPRLSSRSRCAHGRPSAAGPRHRPSSPAAPAPRGVRASYCIRCPADRASARPRPEGIDGDHDEIDVHGDDAGKETAEPDEHATAGQGTDHGCSPDTKTPPASRVSPLLASRSANAMSCEPLRRSDRATVTQDAHGAHLVRIDGEPDRKRDDAETDDVDLRQV